MLHVFCPLESLWCHVYTGNVALKTSLSTNTYKTIIRKCQSIFQTFSVAYEQIHTDYAVCSIVKCQLTLVS